MPRTGPRREHVYLFSSSKHGDAGLYDSLAIRRCGKLDVKFCSEHGKGAELRSSGAGGGGFCAAATETKPHQTLSVPKPPLPDRRLVRDAEKARIVGFFAKLMN